MQIGHDVVVQPAPVVYSMVVEDSPIDVDGTFPPVRTETTATRVRISTMLALTCALLGSSVLPVSDAFAKTGIACGLVISLVVALCNTYTCQLLLTAASATKTSTIEELTAAVGGKSLMRLAQASNIILLFGNLTGDFCLLADLGSKSLQDSLGARAPWILVGNHGRGIMLLLILCVIFPLSLFRGMRALETASSAGVAVVALLFGVLTYDATSAGFHGVVSGEVPMWSFTGASRSDIAKAFALLGFSFYLHPLMMPLLQEMPPGPRGMRILSDCVTIAIMGVAFVTISFVGAMGAATYGKDTKGDIMMNRLLVGPVASTAFAMAMLLYLASCIPPIVLSLRCYLDFLVAGPRAGFRWPRFLALTVGIIAVPMLLAWGNPSLSDRAYALTGATGVCIVCYVIPIVVHFCLLFPRNMSGNSGALQPQIGSDDSVESAATRWLMEEERMCGLQVAGDQAPPAAKLYAPFPETLWGWVGQAALPIVVLVVGVALSGLALYNSISEYVG